jgi:hypothetical protein
MQLTPPGFRPESALPERAPLEDSCLNYVEQLFMLVRNPCRNDPAQLPPGFDVRAPFRRVEWVDFILRLPRQLRSGALLYHEIAARSNPALFALPFKNSLGFSRGTAAWRIDLRRARLKTARTLARRLPNLFLHTNPKLNYADDDAELRRKSPLRTVVEDSLQRLASSGRIDWLQPLELLQQHVQLRANIGDALTVLASIELNLFADAERLAAPVGAGP